MNEKWKAILLLLVAISIALPVCAAQPQGHNGDSGPHQMDFKNDDHMGNFGNDNDHMGDFKDDNKWSPKKDEKWGPWNQTKKDEKWDPWNLPPKDDKRDQRDHRMYNPWWYRYNPGWRMPWLQPWWLEPHNHVWRR